MRTLSGAHGPGAVAGQFEICGNLDLYGRASAADPDRRRGPCSAGPDPRDHLGACQVHPAIEGDLNAIILCWSKAQTNRQLKAKVPSFQFKYRASLTQIVVKWQKRKYLPFFTKSIKDVKGISTINARGRDGSELPHLP
jgi:hypothetical protein